MGPGSTWAADVLGSHVNPPKFITNKTNNSRYSSDLRIKTLAQSAENDTKIKGSTKSSGYAIYKNCDEQAQDIIEQAESDGILSLKAKTYQVEAGRSWWRRLLN